MTLQNASCLPFCSGVRGKDGLVGDREPFEALDRFSGHHRRAVVRQQRPRQAALHDGL